MFNENIKLLIASSFLGDVVQDVHGRGLQLNAFFTACIILSLT